MLQSPGQIAFSLGPVTVRWYGIIIGVGILLCYLYASFAAKKSRVEPRYIDAMAFWVILGGVVGARFYYVLFTFSYYQTHLMEIFQVWKGGLAIHGGLMGGAAVFFLYTYVKKISWRAYADCIAPGVLLAQGLGRWGNFFNNEAFGRPSELPWKLFIPEAFRPRGFEQFSYFHPTFLYESLWNFAGVIVLILLSHALYWRDKKYPHGMIFFGYLSWYSFGRFFIEELRLDSLYLGPLRMAQVASILLFLCGIFGLYFLLRKRRIKA